MKRLQRTYISSEFKLMQKIYLQQGIKSDWYYVVDDTERYYCIEVEWMDMDT